jgi:4-hydroxy-2-oxoheptanedioate aldolase
MKHPVRPNRLRRTLGRGRTAIGPNLQIPSTELVEIIGLAGYDYVMLDGEHGAALTRLPELLLAADAAGLTAIVRVPDHSRGMLLPPLELGAGGLQVPFVNTAAQARAIVQEAKYPPQGGRGLSGVSRAARYGFADGRTYRRDANRETLLIAQIETAEGLANAAEIAAVPGIDMIFIGPADLAQSLGHPTDRLAPETIKAIKQIIRTVGGLKPVSISAFDGHDVARWHPLGVRCFLTSSALPLRNAFRDWQANLRSGLPR